MARKRAESAEMERAVLPTVEAEEPRTVVLELAKAYKRATSIMLNGNLVPVSNGKVTVLAEHIEAMRKGGYVK